jgi:alpha-ketoglutarate-dependent 2,4-dichlorophenoxyacetate dioxygenase
MGLEWRPLHPLFAAETEAVALGPAITAPQVDAIWRAIDEHAVLVFRGQRLDDTGLRGFAARFGPLEIGRAAASAARRRLAHPEIGDISNLDEDGRLRLPGDRRRLDALGNRLWHTDASYMPVPVVLGMLYAVAAPAASALGGGETEFADMRAAYDALPAAMRQAIDDLVAVHDIFWSRGQIGFADFAPGDRERYPPSPHPLVRRHPGSGRKTLYLSAHASHIEGWTVADGRLLLYDLNLHATRPEFVYRHQWRVGDLLIWDNRDTMHRGRPYDETRPRDLRRATTLETRATLVATK